MVHIVARLCARWKALPGCVLLAAAWWPVTESRTRMQGTVFKELSPHILSQQSYEDYLAMRQQQQQQQQYSNSDKVCCFDGFVSVLLPVTARGGLEQRSACILRAAVYAQTQLLSREPCACTTCVHTGARVIVCHAMEPNQVHEVSWSSKEQRKHDFQGRRTQHTNLIWCWDTAHGQQTIRIMAV